MERDLIRSFCLLCVLPIALLAGEAWKLQPGEIIHGAAISPDNSTVYTWGSRLLAWPVSSGQPQVVRERGKEFGEGGCVWDVDQDGRADVIVQEGLGLGKLVWFHAPDWTRREIDGETEFHECLGATLLGHRGLLLVHRYAQVRFYEPQRDPAKPWESNDIYSIYTPSKQTGLLISDVDGDGLPDLYMGNYWIRSPESFDLPWRLFAINTYSQDEESAMMRFALTPDLVVAQGHLADGKVIRYEKNTNIREQWIEHPIGAELNLKFPHGLVSLGEGRFVVSENNGVDSRVILFTPQGHRVIGKGAPAHTLFVVQGKILAVGPDQIRWLSY